MAIITWFAVPLAVFGLLVAMAALPLIVNHCEKKGDWK